MSLFKKSSSSWPTPETHRVYDFLSSEPEIAEAWENSARQATLKELAGELEKYLPGYVLDLISINEGATAHHAPFARDMLQLAFTRVDWLFLAQMFKSADR
ncbi:MAG: hypothetical protein M3Z21_04170 [Pseudomonadota bacterium]|nr:hypothetical protein [Pseudomonadota bacterium]